MFSCKHQVLSSCVLVGLGREPDHGAFSVVQLRSSGRLENFIFCSILALQTSLGISLRVSYIIFLFKCILVSVSWSLPFHSVFFFFFFKHCSVGLSLFFYVDMLQRLCKTINGEKDVKNENMIEPVIYCLPYQKFKVEIPASNTNQPHAMYTVFNLHKASTKNTKLFAS